MRFVITGGGTAGHANPALAVAQELRQAGHEVHFAGTAQGIEARLIPQEGFDYVSFEAAGFNRNKPLSLVTSTAKIARSSLRASRWLKRLKPQLVVGFGGYVSIPVGLAASRLGLPLAIHEQNSTSGMANRFLAKRAQLVALTYASAGEGFATQGKVVLTGNPVRAGLEDIDRAAGRAHFGLPADACVLLVFGGSLGAAHLNEALVAQAPALMEMPGLQVLHITGARDFAKISQLVSEVPQAQGRWHLIEYCDHMGEAYAAADAVLSRAGATTLAELSALGLPSLLVPYPHAAADEQTINARVLVEAGAADLLADRDLDEPVFMEKLTRLITDEPYRATMRQRASQLPTTQARQTLTAHLIELANKHI